MIKAARHGCLSREEIVNTGKESGLFGVYNLGMAHMYEYLKEVNNDKSRSVHNN